MLGGTETLYVGLYMKTRSKASSSHISGIHIHGHTASIYFSAEAGAGAGAGRGPAKRP